jgi:hypothetical protein
MTIGLVSGELATMGHISLITMAIMVIGARAYIPQEKVSSRKIKGHAQGWTWGGISTVVSTEEFN